MKTHFIRVRAGVVIEKGLTDADACAHMREQSSEYREITAEQAATINIGDPAP